MSKNILIICLVSFLLLSGACNSIGPVQKAILKKSDSCATSNKICIFKLNSITNFDWDKMYLFDEDTRPEKIGSLLKTPYSDWVGEDKIRMIFTLNGKIVHQEDFDWGRNAKKVLSSIDLPIDTTSILTQKGCYTKLLPFVSKDDCLYRLINVNPNSYPSDSRLKSKHETIINLIFVKDFAKCYDEQITVEDIQ